MDFEKVKTVFKGDIIKLLKELFADQFTEMNKKLDTIAKKDNTVFIENASDIGVPQIPDEVTVKNFPAQKEIKFPDVQKVEVKQPLWWQAFDYSKILSPITKKFDEIKDVLKGLRTKGVGEKPGNPVYVIPVSPDNNNTPYTITPGRGGGGGGNTDLLNGAFTIGSGCLTCPTPATAVQFPSQACKYIMITGSEVNTFVCFLGNSDVVAQTTPSLAKGFGIFPGQTHKIEISNLNLLYLDSLSAGDGVAYAWFN